MTVYVYMYILGYSWVSKEWEDEINVDIKNIALI